MRTDLLLLETRMNSTYVDELVVVSVLEVPKNSGVIQVSQVRHVLNLLEFRRIDLEDLVLFQRLFL